MIDIEARFTVKELKNICTSLGLPISGTKGVLQTWLRGYFGAALEKRDCVK
jgi:hypothetical protein